MEWSVERTITEDVPEWELLQPMKVATAYWSRGLYFTWRNFRGSRHAPRSAHNSAAPRRQRPPAVGGARSGERPRVRAAPPPVASGSYALKPGDVPVRLSAKSVCM